MPSRHVVIVAEGKDALRWRRAIDRRPVDAAADAPLATFAWHLFDPDRCSDTPPGRRRNGGLRERAARLGRYLREPPFLAARSLDDPEITLVGIRAGSQIVQQFVLDQLRSGPGAPLHVDVRSVRRVRQAIFVGAPRLNAALLLLWSPMLFAVLALAAEVLDRAGVGWAAAVRGVAAIAAGVLTPVSALIFSKETREAVGHELPRSFLRLTRDYTQAVEQGAKTLVGTWPIPTRTMHGLDPAGADALETLAAYAAEPVAHRNLYDVTVFSRATVVRPITDGAVPDDARQAAAEAERPAAITDNAAVYHASITFSDANERRTGAAPDGDGGPGEASRLGLWELRYATSKGVLLVDTRHPGNLWKPEDRVPDYVRGHWRYRYQFWPEPGHTYDLEVRVYGGYTGAEQRAHTHLRADTYYHRVTERFDVSAYLRAGWTLAAPPRVRFARGPLPQLAPAGLAERPLDGLECDCARHDSAAFERREVEVREEPAGVFSWELAGVRDGGLIEVEYQLQRDPDDAAHPAHADERATIAE